MKFVVLKKIAQPQLIKELLMVGAISCGLFSTAQANPDIANVINGQVTFQQQGNTLTITNSAGAIINWQDFSIANGELTQFIQANANSAVLNRVVGGNVSQIMGELTSNGRVFLINQNGIVFSDSAVIDTQGFIASTLNISDDNFKSGILHFVGESGRIENRGLIQVTGSGDIALVSPDITNSGLIKTDNGQILLAAGREVMINSPDFSDILIKVKSPDDSAVNLGEIIANQGSIGLLGGSVNNQGNLTINQRNGRVFIEADQVASSGNILAPGGDITILGDGIEIASGLLDVSAEGQAGDIKIGGDFQGGGDLRRALTTTVGTNATIKADGQQQGNGGEVIVWSDNNTQVDGAISARGGASGGNGGLVETSSKGQLDFTRPADVSAAAGDAGTWLIDPEDINIDESRAGHIESALNQGSNVSIKTSDDGDGEGNITVNAPITKTAGGDATLSLDAHNNIDVNQPITSTSNKLHVNLKAGNAINVNQTIDTNGGDFSSTIVARMPIEDDDSAEDEIMMDELDESAEATESPVAEMDSDVIDQDAEQVVNSDTNSESVELTQKDAAEVSNPIDPMPVQNQVATVAVEQPIAVESNVQDAPISSPGTSASIAAISPAEDNTVGATEINGNDPISHDAHSGIIIGNSINTSGGNVTLDASTTGDIAINDVLSTSVSNVNEIASPQVTVNANNVSLTASIDTSNATGTAGNVIINSIESISFSENAIINSDGAQAGNISIQAQESATFSGAIKANSSVATGGNIDISAGSDLIFRDAELSASGEQGGGRIRLGGEFQGGRNLEADELINAQRLLVDSDTRITADGLGNGANGGEVILWSEDHTVAAGVISAKQHDPSNTTGGGFTEISSKGQLNYLGTTKVGQGGSVLFDPKNITIATPVSTGSTMLDAADEFAEFSGDDVTIDPLEIQALLMNGVAVTLQANNDISLFESSISAGSTAGGPVNLTLQAGRSIIFNATNISTTDGDGDVDDDFTFIANETIMEGVVDQQRDAGAASIQLINGSSIVVDGANLRLEVKDDSSKTNNDSLGVDIQHGSSLVGANVDIIANNIDLSVSGLGESIAGIGAVNTSVGSVSFNAKEDININGDIFSAMAVSIIADSDNNGNGAVRLGGGGLEAQISAETGLSIVSNEIIADNNFSINNLSGDVTFTTDSIQLGDVIAPLNNNSGGGGFISSDGARISITANDVSLARLLNIRSSNNLDITADNITISDRSFIIAENEARFDADDIRLGSSSIISNRLISIETNNLSVIGSLINSGDLLEITADKDNLPGVNTILVAVKDDSVIPTFSEIMPSSIIGSTVNIIGEDLVIRSDVGGMSSIQALDNNLDGSASSINIDLTGDLKLLSSQEGSPNPGVALIETFTDNVMSYLGINANSLELRADGNNSARIQLSPTVAANIRLNGTLDDDKTSLLLTSTDGGRSLIERNGGFFPTDESLNSDADFILSTTDDILIESSVSDGTLSPFSSIAFASSVSEITLVGDLEIESEGSIILDAQSTELRAQASINSRAGQVINARELNLVNNGGGFVSIEDLTSQKITVDNAISLTSENTSNARQGRSIIEGANQDITANNFSLTKQGAGFVAIQNAPGIVDNSSQKISALGVDANGYSIVLDNDGVDDVAIRSEVNNIDGAPLAQTIEAVGKILVSSTLQDPRIDQARASITGADQDIRAESITLVADGGGGENRAEILSSGTQRITTQSASGGDSDITLSSIDSGRVIFASLADTAEFGGVDVPSGDVQIINTNGGDLIISSTFGNRTDVDSNSVNQIFGSRQDLQVGDIRIFSDTVVSGIQSEAGLQEIQANSIEIEGARGTAAIFNQFGGGQKITTSSTNANGDGLSLINSGGGGALLVTTQGGGGLTQEEVTSQLGSASEIDVRQGDLRLSSPASGFAVLYTGNLDLTVAGDILVGESSNQNGSNFISSTSTSNIDAGGDVTIRAGSANGVTSSISAEDTVNLTAAGDVSVIGGSGDNTVASIQADAENTINLTADTLTLQSGTGNNADALLVSANGTGNINLAVNNCVNCDAIRPSDETSDTGFFFRLSPGAPAQPLSTRSTTPTAPELANQAPLVTLIEAANPNFSIPQSIFDIINFIVSLNGQRADIDNSSLSFAFVRNKEEDDDSASFECQADFAA